jgi:DNA-binding PadR family transcriptional regulator
VYELIVLSLLMRRPTHGYVIAGVINDVIGPFARASNGRIYPLLASLGEQGFVVARQESRSEGGRVSRSFAITRAGRARFRALMLDRGSSPREYRDLFAFKVTAFDQISPADRTLLLEHYLEFARAHVRHLQEQGEDIEEHGGDYGHSPEQIARMSSVFEHLIDSWQQEIGWAERLLRGEPVMARAAARSRQ